MLSKSNFNTRLKTRFPYRLSEKNNRNRASQSGQFGSLLLHDAALSSQINILSNLQGTEWEKAMVSVYIFFLFQAVVFLKHSLSALSFILQLIPSIVTQLDARLGQVGLSFEVTKCHQIGNFPAFVAKVRQV